MLPIVAARCDTDDIGAALVLTFADGREATIIVEMKPSLREAGLVELGDEFDDLAPPIGFESEDGYRTLPRGFTNDPRVVKLYGDFLAATDSDTFRPGPVPVSA